MIVSTGVAATVSRSFSNQSKRRPSPSLGGFRKFLEPFFPNTDNLTMWYQSQNATHVVDTDHALRDFLASQPLAELHVSLKEPDLPLPFEIGSLSPPHSPLREPAILGAAPAQLPASAIATPSPPSALPSTAPATAQMFTSIRASIGLPDEPASVLAGGLYHLSNLASTEAVRDLFCQACRPCSRSHDAPPTPTGQVDLLVRLMDHPKVLGNPQAAFNLLLLLQSLKPDSAARACFFRLGGAQALARMMADPIMQTADMTKELAFVLNDFVTDEQHGAALVRAGAAPSLLRLMVDPSLQSHPFYFVAFQTALRLMCTSGEEGQAAVDAARIEETILALVQAPLTPPMMEHLMANMVLCLHSSARVNAFLQTGLLARLAAWVASVFDSGRPFILCTALARLARLPEEKDVAPAFPEGCDAVAEALVDLLRRPTVLKSQDLLARAVLTIGELCDMPLVAFRAAFLKANLLPALLSLLERPLLLCSATLSVDLFWVLHRLSLGAGGEDGFREALVAARVVPLVVALLQHPIVILHGHVAEQLLGVVCGLCFERPQHMRAFMEAGVAPVLAKLLTASPVCGHQRAAKQLVNAVCHLTVLEADYVPLFLESGLVPALANFLRSHRVVNGPIADSFLLAVTNLCLAPDIRAAFVRAQMIPLLEGLQTAPWLPDAPLAFARLAHALSRLRTQPPALTPTHPARQGQEGVMAVSADEMAAVTKAHKKKKKKRTGSK
ncbi:hypothetical protein PAPYR_10139 [Paratrimastix pyriformis]|uniref:Uncharacterized protein n=1 Tax=Paratrimastix pyriformis TaxID=342808 RepID=A0ABQ8UAU1_9EUKA|nr:hypothetical protein PAPYR_10139 [Paratrimastix pyriformis]